MTNTKTMKNTNTKTKTQVDLIFVTDITDYICGEKLPSGEFSEILVKFRGFFFFEKAVLSKFVVIYFFFVEKYTFVGRKMYPKFSMWRKVYPKNSLCGEKMTNIKSE